MNSYEFPGAYPGQHVRLTFERGEFRDAGYVLVFAFDGQGRLLMTRHKKRGWEIPGGTREPGEFAIQTAVREVYEETGAELSALEPLGQYVITADDAPDVPVMVKTIYVAQIDRLHEIPDGFETEERRLFDEPPAPDAVRGDDAYSLILKDDVYRRALERLQGHRFLGKGRA